MAAEEWRREEGNVLVHYWRPDPHLERYFCFEICTVACCVWSCLVYITIPYHTIHVSTHPHRIDCILRSGVDYQLPQLCAPVR